MRFRPLPAAAPVLYVFCRTEDDTEISQRACPDAANQYTLFSFKGTG
jgi:hypothetical protein